jgi:hypothetical protein
MDWLAILVLFFLCFFPKGLAVLYTLLMIWAGYDEETLLLSLTLLIASFTHSVLFELLEA